MSNVRYPSVNIYGVHRDFQRELNRIFDNVCAAPRKAAEQKGEGGTWRPVVDVHEDATGYIIDVELPGLTKENVAINFEDGTLSISGERGYRHERKSEDENGAGGNASGQEKAHRTERVYGAFHRGFKFPAAVNSDGISARFENGVLTIVVPKAEVIRPRQIAIQ